MEVNGEPGQTFDGWAMVQENASDALRLVLRLYTALGGQALVGREG